MLLFQLQSFTKPGFSRILLLLSGLSGLFFSCQPSGDQAVVRVILPRTALRDAPGERGREIRTLAAQDQLTDLGVVSRFETQLRLGDQSLVAPWLQVKAADGQPGWVFSGAVQPLRPDTAWMLDKKMRCYVGDALTLRRDRWWATQAGVNDAVGLAAYYHEALALRDTFTYKLAHRAEPNAADVHPDFSWLNKALPGFVFQRVAQGTQPYLFTDYRYFQALALRTADAQDDRWLAVCLLAYPTDSVESIAPAWTLQVDEQQVVSQLGLGKHWQLLQAIEFGLQTPTPLFQADLLRMKEAILEDMLGKNKIYWQIEKKILAELNKILASPMACLTPADRDALVLRLEMFRNPAAYGLSVNQRAGE